MIKIGVQTGGPQEILGVDGAYKLISEIGFDAVDANIDQIFTPGQINKREVPACITGSEKDFLEAIKPWKDASEKYNLPNYQAHAPFPSYVFDEKDESYNDLLLDMLKRIIRGCDYINCRNLIVHPFFLGYEHQLDAKTEWELNIERYSALIPAAKEYGVTICLENMFTGHNGKIMSAICSDITQACDYIDTLNGIAGTKQFGFCADIGHLLVCGLDIRASLNELGDRICAFHVHDNDGMHDDHVAPYMGIADWDRFAQALKDIKYDKVMSFETFNVWGKFPPDVAPDIMRGILSSGRHFING